MALPSRKQAIQVLLGAALVGGVASFTFVRGTKLFAFDDESPTEASSPLPDSMSNVLEPTEKLTADEVRSGEPWRATDFSKQSGGLDWGPTTFTVPEDLKKRVNFWKKIYSKYTTDQGVLHDPVTLDVYESIDFEPFKPGESLSVNAKAREKVVNARRALVSERLLMLQERLDRVRSKALTTPFEPAPTPVFGAKAGENDDPAFDLSGDDLRYWHLFDGSTDPNKFRKAAARIRFQLGQRDKFLLGIFESGRYLRHMEKIFHDEGLPIELTRLPFVESSFNTRARSKVGASGIWQFMRRTAKPYLKINQSIDERNDPLAATRAAAKLMRNNFEMVRTWPLTVTAWNHGPSGVRNISQRMATIDIAKIVNTYSSRTFGFASQNFYACFLAVLDVESHATTYFSNPVWQKSLEFTEVKTPHTIAWPSVVKLFADNEEMAADYNPQITAFARSSKPRIPGGTKLRLPPDAIADPATLFGHEKPSAPKLVKRPAVQSSSGPTTPPVDTAAPSPASTPATSPIELSPPPTVAPTPASAPEATPQPTDSASPTSAAP